MTTPEKIKLARQAAKMTQKQLGAACEIDEANIRKYEAGRQNPKKETLEKIASALNLPTIFFMLDKYSFYISPTDGQMYVDEPLGEIEDEDCDPVLVELKYSFYRLNSKGRSVAVSRVQELTQIPKYQRETPGEAAPTPPEGKDQGGGENA